MVIIKRITHKGHKRIGIFFDYDNSLINIVKNIPDRKYSNTLKCWHLPVSQVSINNIKKAGLPIDPQQFIDLADQALSTSEKTTNKKVRNKEYFDISSDWLEKIDKFRKHLYELRYSESSIKSYVLCIELFLAWVSKNNSSKVTLDSIRQYNYEFFIEKKKSRSYQNIWINALKLFLTKNTDLDINVAEIERPRKSEYLPEILSKEEVKSFIKSFDNLKHRTIVTFYYACGLRKSELINLRIQDIDKDRCVIRIRNSKGAKDRDVALPKLLHQLLEEYINAYHPKVYLFNGQNRSRYSASSVNKLIKKGLLKAGIKKKITAHNLRHTYATHLVEHQVNLRYIQEALGHRSSTTTEIYTKLSRNHISEMISPVDYWEEDITDNQ